jgi:uncharacterized CHY-type Zn-finger protein
VRPIVHGLEVDAATRCLHWHSPLDVVAIKMNCCRLYYACKDCHDALADHPLTTWSRDTREEKAVLCGDCGLEMSISDYLGSGNACPGCRTKFNPGCARHHHFYFEIDAV